MIRSQSEDSVKRDPKTNFPVEEEKAEYWSQKVNDLRKSQRDFVDEFSVSFEKKQEELNNLKEEIENTAKDSVLVLEDSEPETLFALDESMLDVGFNIV